MKRNKPSNGCLITTAMRYGTNGDCVDRGSTVVFKLQCTTNPVDYLPCDCSFPLTDQKRTVYLACLPPPESITK